MGLGFMGLELRGLAFRGLGNVGTTLASIRSDKEYRYHYMGL